NVPPSRTCPELRADNSKASSCIHASRRDRTTPGTEMKTTAKLQRRPSHQERSTKRRRRRLSSIFPSARFGFVRTVDRSDAARKLARSTSCPELAQRLAPRTLSEKVRPDRTQRSQTSLAKSFGT